MMYKEGIAHTTKFASLMDLSIQLGSDCPKECTGADPGF